MFGKKKLRRPQTAQRSRPVQRIVNAAMMPSAGLQASILEKNAKGQSRIIPSSVFESETGAILKQLGMTPDDPSNLIPSLDDHQAKIDALQDEERNFVAKINSQLPESAQVVPFAMIPVQCWTKGPHASLLYNYLEFYPLGAWNTLLMPKTDAGAFVLSMTKCPQGVSNAHIAQCNTSMGDIFRKMRLKVDGVKDVAEAGNMDAYNEMPKIKVEAEAAIMTLAFLMGKAIMGQESFVKCRSMFFGDGELAKLV